MAQTTGRIFDEMARLVNDAAGVAQGMRREAETLAKTQMERFLREMDLVKREEFDAVKEMASAARLENERLAAKLHELEALVKASTPAQPYDQTHGSAHVSAQVSATQGGAPGVGPSEAPGGSGQTASSSSHAGEPYSGTPGAGPGPV